VAHLENVSSRLPGRGCAPYVYNEVFDLKPTSGYTPTKVLENSAHLSNFLTQRTVSAHSSGPKRRKHSHGFVLIGGSYDPKGQENLAQGLPWETRLVTSCPVGASESRNIMLR
jgi:hypothetical protein